MIKDINVILKNHEMQDSWADLMEESANFLYLSPNVTYQFRFIGPFWNMQEIFIPQDLQKFMTFNDTNGNKLLNNSKLLKIINGDVALAQEACDQFKKYAQHFVNMKGGMRGGFHPEAFLLWANKAKWPKFMCVNAINLNNNKLVLLKITKKILDEILRVSNPNFNSTDVKFDNICGPFAKDVFIARLNGSSPPVVTNPPDFMVDELGNLMLGPVLPPNQQYVSVGNGIHVSPNIYQHAQNKNSPMPNYRIAIKFSEKPYMLPTKTIEMLLKHGIYDIPKVTQTLNKKNVQDGLLGKYIYAKKYDMKAPSDYIADIDNSYSELYNDNEEKQNFDSIEDNFNAIDASAFDIDNFENPIMNLEI